MFIMQMTYGSNTQFIKYIEIKKVKSSVSKNQDCSFISIEGTCGISAMSSLGEKWDLKIENKNKNLLVAFYPWRTWEHSTFHGPLSHSLCNFE